MTCEMELLLPASVQGDASLLKSMGVHEFILERLHNSTQPPDEFSPGSAVTFSSALFIPARGP